MDTLLLIILAILLVFVVGLIIGWVGRGHVHAAADAAVSAVTRATTISSGDVTALNDKIEGLGDKVQTLAQQVQQPAVV